MRQNPSFALTDPEEIKRLIRENPWATLVSSTPDGMVVSHYPIVLDDEREELSVLTHVGRPDDLLHVLGEGEVVLISSGPENIELLEDIAVQVRKAGAFPIVTVGTDRMAKRLYTDVPEKYDAQVDQGDLKLAGVVNAAIFVSAFWNRTR